MRAPLRPLPRRAHLRRSSPPSSGPRSRLVQAKQALVQGGEAEQANAIQAKIDAIDAHLQEQLPWASRVQAAEKRVEEATDRLRRNEKALVVAQSSLDAAHEKHAKALDALQAVKSERYDTEPEAGQKCDASARQIAQINAQMSYYLQQLVLMASSSAGSLTVPKDTMQNISGLLERSALLSSAMEAVPSQGLLLQAVRLHWVPSRTSSFWTSPRRRPLQSSQIQFSDVLP